MSVPSPCISICRMDPSTQWCEGCFRTLEEIAAWGSLSDAEKQGVWKELRRRGLGRAGELGLTKPSPSTSTASRS